MTKLRCGIIGCGRIGCGFDNKSNNKRVLTHAGSYFLNPKTNLVALCDIDKSKLKKYGKKYHIKGLYVNPAEMFQKEKLDCVSISTLLDEHKNLVEEAVNYGIKGIFLEKPISYDLNSAKKIIKTCKENKIKLIINHQRRFDPFYHDIKSFLTRNKLGKLQLIDVYYGGGIANTGSHLFDLLRFFFGEVKQLKSSLSKNKSHNHRDPNLDVTLEFKNGLKCNIHAIDFRKFIIFNMNVFGNLGYLRTNLIANVYDVDYFKVHHDPDLGLKTLNKSTIKFRKPSFSSIYMGVENLVNCLNSRVKPLCTGEDGYKSLELIIASIQSYKKNKLIKLPIPNNKFKISSK